jgi:DNA-binding LytR/AlgR family response regulator
MLMCIVLVVWIALGNFLFVNFLSGWKAMGYFSFVRMIGYTTLIGIFPVALSGVVIQLRATQKNEESASDISEHLHPEKDSVSQQTVVLEAENGQQLGLKTMDVCYIEAMQNYVTVWFLKDGKLAKEMLRATIASVEEKFAGTDVIRCHRSFLVNVDCIEKVSGNAQGLRLQLKGLSEMEVPVSRSFIPKIRELLD